jgi:hypothetical protein
MAFRFLKAGSEVRVEMTTPGYAGDPPDVPAGPPVTRFRHGVVTSVSTQDSIMVRLGRGVPVAASRIVKNYPRFRAAGGES